MLDSLCSRMAPSEPFFRMQEVPGSANSETCISLLESTGRYWRYQLQPVSGCKHQLRLHMAGLGAPICNDPFYPLSGEPRRFDSQLELHTPQWPPRPALHVKLHRADHSRALVLSSELHCSCRKCLRST